jgi:hypothetical protein
MEFRRQGTRDQRRRRVCLEDAPDETPAPSRGRSRTASGSQTLRQYAEAARCEHQPRVTDLIPKRRWTVLVLMLLALTQVTGLLALYVLIDISKSCDYGEPNKAHYIKQVAAALGYIGLVNYNRVTIAAVNNTVHAETGAMRGRTRVPQMLDFLQKLSPQGASHLAEACRRFALQHRQKGVCVVLSDFFDKGGYENGLRYVAGGKYDLFCLQTLAPQEIEPDLQGDLKLRDIEDDDTAEVSITRPLLNQYKANLNAYCLALKDYITRRGGTYLFTSTAVPFDTLVLNYLRERGLLG